MSKRSRISAGVDMETGMVRYAEVDDDGTERTLSHEEAQSQFGSDVFCRMVAGAVQYVYRVDLSDVGAIQTGDISGLFAHLDTILPVTWPKRPWDDKANRVTGGLDALRRWLNEDTIEANTQLIRELVACIEGYSPTSPREQPDWAEVRQRLLRIFLDHGVGPLHVVACQAADVVTYLEMKDPKKDTPDTKTDTPKKKRKMNKAAVWCGREYRKRCLAGDKTPMKDVIQEYIDDNGGSHNTIRKILSDNPDQWKVDTK